MSNFEANLLQEALELHQTCHPGQHFEITTSKEAQTKYPWMFIDFLSKGGETPPDYVNKTVLFLDYHTNGGFELFVKNCYSPFNLKNITRFHPAQECIDKIKSWAPDLPRFPADMLDVSATEYSGIPGLGLFEDILEKLKTPNALKKYPLLDLNSPASDPWFKYLSTQPLDYIFSKVFEAWENQGIDWSNVRNNLLELVPPQARRDVIRDLKTIPHTSWKLLIDDNQHLAQELTKMPGMPKDPDWATYIWLMEHSIQGPRIDKVIKRLRKPQDTYGLELLLNNLHQLDRNSRVYKLCQPLLQMAKTESDFGVRLMSQYISALWNRTASWRKTFLINWEAEFDHMGINATTAQNIQLHAWSPRPQPQYLSGVHTPLLVALSRLDRKDFLETYWQHTNWRIKQFIMTGCQPHEMPLEYLNECKALVPKDDTYLIKEELQTLVNGMQKIQDSINLTQEIKQTLQTTSKIKKQRH